MSESDEEPVLSGLEELDETDLVIDDLQPMTLIGEENNETSDEEESTDEDDEPSDTEMPNIKNLTSSGNNEYLPEDYKADDFDIGYMGGNLGEDEFNKFSKELKDEYLVNFHPESKNHNYEEIRALAQVKRNVNNVIVDELHKTIPILTKFEKTRILGQRTMQLNNGHKPFIKVEREIIDNRLIAESELSSKRIPFIIRRTLPNGGAEYWNLRDLEII
tara:strand:- start:1328 stop:1981 length:654 start_codon:yes stop_codon:yes gene_type:complete